MERAEIERLIPHREPFLFVDRVVDRTENGLTAQWLVREDAWFFRGHYPGFPLMPGVLLCEAAVQAGALLVAGDPRDRAPAGHVPVLVKLGLARFRRMVRPGELLSIDVTLDERVGPARVITGRISCEGRNVARVQFTVAIAPAGGLEP